MDNDDATQMLPAHPAPPLRATETFWIRVEMLSDWHVGTGAGQSSRIDRLVARDDDDLPYIPAKSLTGVLRDGCERLASCLDHDAQPGAGQAVDRRPSKAVDDEEETIEDRSWSQWVQWLFGDEPGLGQSQPSGPRKAIVGIRPARLPRALVQRLAHSSPEAMALRGALTFLKPGVKIDAETGQAVDDMLRTDEVARAGMVLAAPAVLQDIPTALVATARALLVGGALLTDHLGGKRRRGTGRCALRLTGADFSAWQWDSLRPYLEASAPPLPQQTRATRHVSGRRRYEPSAAADHQRWISIPLTLQLRTPLSSPARTVGNVGKTLDYLPGSSLLPVVARALGDAGFDAANLIAADAVRVLAATLSVQEHRGLPMPFALEEPKDVKGLSVGQIRNRLVESREDDDDDKQWRQVRTGHLALAEDFGSPQRENDHLENDRQNDQLVLPAWGQVATVLRTHNTIDNATQRPGRETGGGVYSYEAIASGTCLRSEIHLRADLAAQLPEDWARSLETTVSLGRAKKDDYGQVDLAVGAAQERQPMLSDQPAPDGSLTVWCLSDLLLRDCALRPETGCRGLALALSEALQVRIRCDDRVPPRIRTSRMDSWQARWALPRPSLVGIAAGSCARFIVEGELAPQRLRTVALEGLGERRAEGFGHLALNVALPTRAQQSVITAPSRSTAQAEPRAGAKDDGALVLDDLDESVQGFARDVEDAAWRALISLHVASWTSGGVETAETLGFRPGTVPNGSQLGALRAAVSAGPDRAEAWVHSVLAVEARRNTWIPALDKANGVPSGRLAMLLLHPRSIWTALDDHAREHQGAVIAWPTLVSKNDEIQKRLWWEATTSLILQVLHQLQRGAQQERVGRGVGGADHADERPPGSGREGAHAVYGSMP